MTPTAAPTRVRYSILFLLCLLAMITYMDRALLGSIKPDLMSAVAVDEDKFFLITAAFQLAYALFEIPAGWLGDRYGPRSTLLRIVVWWSLFVALTSLAGARVPGGEAVLVGFWGLLLIQFLFGVGEAGAFPNMSKAIYNWFPLAQRGTAQGGIWMSARLMGGLTPIVWVLFTRVAGMDWKQVLWTCASLGLVWCAAFAYWFRNRPDEHPGVNDAELTLVTAGRTVKVGYSGVPWRTLFTSRNVLALCLMYTVTNYNWYFLMYDLPSLLKGRFKEWGGTVGGDMTLGLLGGAPLLIGMAGCFLGGRLTDRYVRRTGDRKWGRRLFGMVGYGLAGLFYLGAAAGADNLWVFAGFCMLVGFANDLIMAPAWAATQDIGLKYAAIVGGAMNMVGNLGATLGRLVSREVLSGYKLPDGTIDPTGYSSCFVMYAVVYGMGVLAWLLIDASKPAVPESDRA